MIVTKIGDLQTLHTEKQTDEQIYVIEFTLYM